ncbi:MAG: O-antigen polymerase [Bacteroidales bacterium]|nr:O-antigen polymerase [Bacteroidales bacterium]
MFIALIVIFSLAWGYLYYKYRDVFSPWSVTLLVWVLIISLYTFMDHGLYDSGPQFVKAILIWNTGFCLSAYFSFRLTPAYTGIPWAKNPQHIKFLTWVCVLLIPVMLYKSLSFALANGSVTDLVYNLRQQIIDDRYEFSLGPLIYLIHVAYVLLLVTIDEDRVKRPQFWLALTLCICYFIVTMSKQTFFMIAVSMLYVYYVRKKISLKPFIIFGVVFVVLGILFTNFRLTSSGRESTYDFMDLLSMYVVSPIVAFCYDSPNSAHYFGEYTLKSVNNLLAIFGGGHRNVQMFQEMVSVPIPTNVFTMMSPYFKDFGYNGLAVISVIEGLFMGGVYKLSESGHNIMRLIYTYILTLLVLQFFDELFFVGMSNFVQIIILLIFCHIKFDFSGTSQKPVAL